MTAQAFQNKSIYEYDNFRNFLRDFYLAAKKKHKKMSFRYFSRLAGLASPSSLKRVMDGERKLTPDGIAKFAKALKLSKAEASFFEKLVKFNQSEDAKERQSLVRELVKFRGYQRMKPFNQAQFNCLANWYYLPIREMVNLPHFVEDPQWIAKHLHPPIKASEAKKALDEMLQLGLLVHSAEGKLIQSNAHISTGDEVTSGAVANYHRQLLTLASDSIESVAREHRDISAMTLGVSEKSAKTLKEMIQNFRKEVVEFLAQQPDDNESVYQLNLQLFPVINLQKESD
ncbi:MAG: TIGR02147 family protein [Pseudobdellovibrionaceae bacterium]